MLIWYYSNSYIDVRPDAQGTTLQKYCYCLNMATNVESFKKMMFQHEDTKNLYETIFKNEAINGLDNDNVDEFLEYGQLERFATTAEINRAATLDELKPTRVLKPELKLIDYLNNLPDYLLVDALAVQINVGQGDSEILADVAIRRALKDSTKEYLVTNLVGRIPDDAAKKQISTLYEQAKLERLALGVSTPATPTPASGPLTTVSGSCTLVSCPSTPVSGSRTLASDSFTMEMKPK